MERVLELAADEIAVEEWLHGWVTDEQIEALRQEAAMAGDDDQVWDCDLALGAIVGDSDGARTSIARLLASKVAVQIIVSVRGRRLGWTVCRASEVPRERARAERQGYTYVGTEVV
jgi:hypothetical protein